ncbi:MAG TPA: hypothetical protein VGG64_06820 [Pirellulales bacterium]
MNQPRRIHRTTQRGIARRRVARRGVALIAVLCCLMVAAVVVLNMLRSTIMEQRQLRGQRQHLQAERLAEAGLERGLAQLQQSSTYAGEIWRITAVELGGASAGAVTIRVEPLKDRPQERTILVQADYPDDPLHRVRKTREASFTLSQ